MLPTGVIENYIERISFQALSSLKFLLPIVKGRVLRTIVIYVVHWWIIPSRKHMVGHLLLTK